MSEPRLRYGTSNREMTPDERANGWDSLRQRAEALGMEVVEDSDTVEFRRQGVTLAAFNAGRVSAVTLGAWVQGYALGVEVVAMIRDAGGQE